MSFLTGIISNACIILLPTVGKVLNQKVEGERYFWSLTDISYFHALNSSEYTICILYINNVWNSELFVYG